MQFVPVAFVSSEQHRRAAVCVQPQLHLPGLRTLGAGALEKMEDVYCYAMRNNNMKAIRKKAGLS
jgi:hypothetical protein